MRARILAMAAVSSALLAACDDPARQLTGPAAGDPPSVRVVRLPCNVTWANPVNGKWEDASRWDRGSVPTATDVVCIPAGAYRVTVASGTAFRVYLDDAALTIKASSLLPGGSVGGKALLYAPSLEAGSLIADRGSIDTESGARMDLGRLELAVSTIFLDGNHQIDTLIVDSTALIYPRAATVRGVGSLVLEGHVYLSQGMRLSVHLSNTTGATATLRGARVDGDGGKVYLIGAPGTSPTVSWDGGTLSRGTVSDTTILTIRGANLALDDDQNSGDIEVDPAGDTVALSGTIGSDASVYVTLGNSGSAGTVHLQDLRNEGELELMPSTGVVTFTGALMNDGTLVLGGRADLAVDSLVNERYVEVSDSVRLTRGEWVNRYDTQIWGPQAELVVAGGATFVGQSSFTIGETVHLEPGGTLAGTARMNRLVSLGGIITPGTQSGGSGRFTVDSLVLDSASRVVIEVGGGDTASLHDQIFVNYHAALSGTLEVQTLPSFTGAACGQLLFPVVKLNTGISGDFDSLVQAGASPTVRWRTHIGIFGVELIGYDPTTLVSVSPAAIASTEGGGSTLVSWCVAGAHDPSGDVVVDITSRTGQTSVTSPLTLTPASWSYAKLSFVRAIDDAVAEPVQVDSISFRLTSSDPAFNGTATQQLVHTITDNDPGPDLTIAHVAGPLVVNAGQRVEAVFRVTNNGPVNSSGATVTITPVAGLAFVSSAPTAPCTSSAGTVTCTVGGVASGSFLEFYIVFDATTAGVHANTVRVAGNELDPVPANDSVVYTVTVN